MISSSVHCASGLLGHSALATLSSSRTATIVWAAKVCGLLRRASPILRIAAFAASAAAASVLLLMMSSPGRYAVARRSIAMICTGVHVPPRAVGTPRALSAAAIPRNVVIPDFLICSITGFVFVAKASAFSRFFSRFFSDPLGRSGVNVAFHLTSLTLTKLPRISRVTSRQL